MKDGTKTPETVTVAKWLFAQTTHVVGSKLNFAWWWPAVSSYTCHVWSKSVNGLRCCGGRKWPFPITLASGLYNSLYCRRSRDKICEWALNLCLKCCIVYENINMLKMWALIDVLRVKRTLMFFAVPVCSTRSSADADNGLDAFSSQSRSTNMVPFWVHCDFSLSIVFGTTLYR